eukprot:5070297-Prymnesium_polylepis.3
MEEPDDGQRESLTELYNIASTMGTTFGADGLEPLHPTTNTPNQQDRKPQKPATCDLRGCRTADGATAAPCAQPPSQVHGSNDHMSNARRSIARC